MAFGLSPDSVVVRVAKTAWRRIKQLGRTLLHLLPVFVPGIIFVGVGAMLLERYHASDDIGYKLAGLFISELGFACLIAVFIFAIIEQWAAREHGKTAIGHLYGVRPVGDFFKKIEKHVLKQAFYREKTIVTYMFERRSGENLLIRYDVDYVVRNICTDESKERFMLSGSVTTKRLQTGPTEWDSMLGIRGLKVRGKPVALDRLRINENAANRTQTYKAKRSEPIPYPGACEVKASHYLVRHDHDSVAWQAGLPSECVELHLEWSPDLNLEFAIEAIHPDAGPLKPEIGPNKRIYRVKRPFLIGHGFHFWWWSPGPEGAGDLAELPGPGGDSRTETGTVT